MQEMFLNILNYNVVRKCRNLNQSRTNVYDEDRITLLIANPLASNRLHKNIQNFRSRTDYLINFQEF